MRILLSILWAIYQGWVNWAKLGMSEQERERIYWQISLCFALLSSVFFVHAPITKMPYPRSLEFVSLLPVIGALLPIITETIILRLKGRAVQKFWIKEPSVRCLHSINRENPKTCTQNIISRLESLGFNFEKVELPSSFNLKISKQRAKHRTDRFLDNAFSSEINLTESGFGTTIKTDFTYHDTIIVKTGEMEMIQKLCDYLSLKTSHFTYQQIPFTLLVGLNLSFFSVYLSIANLLTHASVAVWLNQSSRLAIAILVFSLFRIIFERKVLIS
jgi:hypothetical protein